MKMRRFNSTGIEMARHHLAAGEAEYVAHDIPDYLDMKYTSEIARQNEHRPVEEF